MYIVDWSREFDTAEDVADYIVNNLYDDVFDAMLDECNEDIFVCGYSYSPAEVFASVDPVAYRCAKADYYNSLATDIVYELNGMNNEEEKEFYDFSVMYREEEEEE